MSGFRAVNTTTLTLPTRPPGSHDENTPTTPRQNRFFAPEHPHSDPHAEDPTAKTPTRDSFNGMSGQKPLPTSPFKPKDIPESKTDAGLSRGNSYRSNKSPDSQDAGMEDEEADNGSDNESVSDSVRPSKKKKGQRFFCKDYPPCQLSFTRSEHLARHIRKHTGERPFQCHCSRRFSRLDNLRQHAQTVHVNEDIPDGSLAATGTRFQRQIRTDRVRPPGSRSRASTLGSQGTHSRGHSRNLSTSSIASMASTTSTMSQRDDFRRPPVTLAMADDGSARARLSLDTFSNGAPNMTNQSNHYGPFGTQSPSGVATPASSTYSTGGSPRFSSGMQSPVSNASRSFAFGSSRTPGRRTSLPSSGNPFQPPPQGAAPAFGLPFIAPLAPTTGAPPSGQSSAFASPTSSTFSDGRRESLAEADWRRRTWHPSTQTNVNTQRPATSGLSYFQTPDAPQPVSSNQPAASQVVRLPGIESFDHAPAAPSLIRRQPSPMQIDPPSRPTGFPSPPEYTPSRSEARRNHISWDVSLNKGLNRLDITSATPPTESQPWSRDGQAPSSRPSSGYFGQQPQAPNSASAEQQPQHQSQHQRHSQTQQPQPQPQPQTQPANRASHEPPVTPRRNKRMGWYAGPPSARQPQPVEHQPAPLQINHILRTSPEDSSGSEGIATPASSTLGEYQPAIVNSHGEVEQRGSAGAQFEEPHKLNQIAQNRHSYGGTPTVPHHGYATVRAPPAFTLQAPPSRDILAGGRMHSQNGSDDMRRLEALVAVATREDKAFTTGA